MYFTGKTAYLTEKSVGSFYSGVFLSYQSIQYHIKNQQHPNKT
jgi:hypothetical protein